MADRPIVLVHGYSDTGEGFDVWRKELIRWGKSPTEIHIGNYVSLSNEITLKDVAEGFDRALDHNPALAGKDFDAIVHSTGMLVIRAWLDSYAEGKERLGRLKHLIAFAPATNGSPLAHKGRSWLGALFKGNRTPGPDFMNAGDEILHALELGSRFTWDLAHADLIGENARFRPGPDTPFVFTFCGSKDYGFHTRIFSNAAGSDGTVRWAGCALNSRKVDVNLMAEPGSHEQGEMTPSEWANQDHPLILLPRMNHSTIMRRPTPALKRLVKRALDVETATDFNNWNEEALEEARPTLSSATKWQQFVIRVTDERGDPVPDWNVQLLGARDDTKPLRFALDVHPCERDPSIRCFHVNLDVLKPDQLSQLHLRLLATSGTTLVAYHGVGSERIAEDGTAINADGVWDARVDLTPVLGNNGFKFFFPFTTTFVEIRLNREPMPMLERNEVFWFTERNE